MKEFNGIVRVGETADIEKAVEMPFSEVLKLPSFKGEGRGRKPIYNFICFAFGFGENDYKYYKKVFIKECMESWKIRFPLSRYIFINVEDCLELSLWTKSFYKRKIKNYATDSIRIYFVSLLDNCFYLDTDVYVDKDANLYLNENEYVANGTTGTLTWNKKRNNKKYQEWFELYENEVFYDLKTPGYHPNDYSDGIVYKRYGNRIKIKSIVIADDIFHVNYNLVDRFFWENNFSFKIFPDSFSHYIDTFRDVEYTLKKEKFWAVCSAYYEKFGDKTFIISLITNNNRFYVKLENGMPVGISFIKKDGYNISYSNRLFWDWAKYYIDNGKYKIRR